MTQALEWTHRGAEIPEGGLRKTRSASPAERDALAAALDVLSCDEMRCDYVIRGLGQSRFTLSGEVESKFTQSCVVTLKPVTQSLRASFSVEFCPKPETPEAESAEQDVLSANEIEPLMHGLIDVGRIVFETLSANIDPYPRKPGAEFDWQEPVTGDEPAPMGPFAGLRKLKEGE